MMPDLRMAFDVALYVFPAVAAAAGIVLATAGAGDAVSVLAPVAAGVALIVAREYYLGAR